MSKVYFGFGSAIFGAVLAIFFALQGSVPLTLLSLGLAGVQFVLTAANYRWWVE